MKDDNKTKKQLIDELMELRSHNAGLEKTTAGMILLELAAEEARRYAESILGTVRGPLLVLDANLKIISANRNFYTTFKVNSEETIGTFIYELGNKQWDIPKLRELLEEVLPEKEAFEDFEVDHNFQDIGHKIMLLNARQIFRKDIGAKMILLAIEDITEHKRMESLLIDSEEQYRRLFETASDGIVLLEKREGKITQSNPASEKMLGYTKKDIIGNSLQDIGVVLDTSDFQTTMQILNKSGIINYRNVTVETKSGKHIDTEIYLVDRAKLVQCNIRDITERTAERKQAGETGEALRESEARYRSLFENNHAVMLFIDPYNGAIVDANAAACTYYGWRIEELRKMRIDEINTLTREDVSTEMQLALSEKRSTFFFKHRRADGSIRDVEVYSGPIPVKGKTLLYSIVHDITLRKHVQEALKQSENKYRLLADNVSDVIFVLDMNLIYTYVSPSVKILIGYEPEELLNQSAVETMTPASWALVIKAMSEVMKLKQYVHGPPISRTIQLEMRRKDGTTVWTEITASLMSDINQTPVGILGVTRDITERKRAEDTLKESEGKHRLLFESAGDGIIIHDAGARILAANPLACERLGYSHAELMSMTINQVDSPAEAAYAQDRIAQLMEQGYLAFETVHQRKDGSFIPIDVIARRITWDGRTAVMSICRDITKRKKTEDKLISTLESLKNALHATIHVLISAIEVRDPYTAGHQVRSADLARAIAVEMNLPQDRIEAISMAGPIHDIGKLSVPAELLSKPTKLTALEFSLIKEHAQTGYEMLKDVESPWPLAEIVHQHHERMNGSGYPRNLKGEEILIEARILAVADVVESMASHRPYRPALGLNAALEEIENNKETLFDADAVDVCLKLFREKGFQLKGA
jgi:PAS domain S-box-containing protein